MAPAATRGEADEARSLDRLTVPMPLVGVLTLLPLAFLTVFVVLGGAAPGDDGASSAPAAPTASFDEAFRPAEHLTLEEPDSALVSGVRAVAVRDDGVVAVPDAQQDHVRFYGPDGELLADVGGHGSGPGELTFPTDVAFDDRGRLYVAEGGQPRVSRFGRDFSFDTLFAVRGAYAPTEIGSPGDRLVLYVNRPEPAGEALRLYTPDGRRTKTFHPQRREYREVPYWDAAVQRLMAVSDSWVVAGASLLYPFALYDRRGVFRDSIGTPPPSWDPAPRPELGAFSGPDQMKEFEKWRRTFTTVDNLAIYRDSLLVVSHEKLDPDVLAYAEGTYRADVYRIESGRKLLEDVPLPGRLLEGGRYVHLLLSSPPGGWTIGRFRLAAEGLRR